MSSDDVGQTGSLRSVAAGIRLTWGADRKRVLLTAVLAVVGSLLPAATLLLTRDLVNAVATDSATGVTVVACGIALAIALSSRSRR